MIEGKSPILLLGEERYGRLTSIMSNQTIYKLLEDGEGFSFLILDNILLLISWGIGDGETFCKAGVFVQF